MDSSWPTNSSNAPYTGSDRGTADRPLRIGIIGPGKICENKLAPAITATPGAQLWSVQSRDENRAEDFGKRHVAQAPVVAYTDLDRMLADPNLDAVLIATPDRFHSSQAIAASKAGKHVFCEKPLAISNEEGLAMVEACEQADVRLGIRLGKSNCEKRA